MNFSTLTSLNEVISGEKDTIFFFNINVDTTSKIYDYFNDNNYITFGASTNTESIDPSFSVLYKYYKNY